MPVISPPELVLVIRAVDREISRLMEVPDDTMSEAEARDLVAYESLADTLEEAYATVSGPNTNMPKYATLVTDRGYSDE